MKGAEYTAIMLALLLVAGSATVGFAQDTFQPAGVSVLADDPGDGGDPDPEDPEG